MKLFIFILGVAAGAYGLYYYQNHRAEAPDKKDASHTSATDEKNPSFGDRVRDDVKAAKDAVAAKFVEWHLTSDEIKKDLEHSGQVVRTKAVAVGETVASSTSNARIVAVIKAKYTLDKELSARAIEVDCDKGDVTLRGNVASPALIAKAIALALDTDGVSKVQSLLAVTAEKH